MDLFIYLFENKSILIWFVCLLYLVSFCALFNLFNWFIVVVIYIFFINLQKKTGNVMEMNSLNLWTNVWNSTVLTSDIYFSICTEHVAYQWLILM